MMLRLAMILTLAFAAPAASAVTEARYEGDISYEAHFRRPGETRPYKSLQRFYADDAGAYRMEWYTWQATDSARGEPESFLVVGESVFHRDAPGKRWKALAGERAELARMQAAAVFPNALATEMKGHVVEEHDASDRVHLLDA